MSVIIKMDNYGASNKLETTYLNADAAALATTITLKNIQSISVGANVGFYLLIGKPGQENTELRRVLILTGLVVTLDSALVNAHSKYDDVTVLNANQLKVYRATAPTDGSKPAITAYALVGDPIDIDYDNLTTRFTDASGGSTYWYRYAYYNSHTLAESELANSNDIRGGSLTDYCSIRDIREEAGIVNNPYISDTYIAGKRTEAQSKINSALKGTYPVPFTAPVSGLITHITILFAAGYILKREYGDGALGTNADGNAKITEAQAELDKIINGTSDPVDDSGVSTISSRQAVTGWPNADTATTPSSEGGGVRKFRAGMKF